MQQDLAVKAVDVWCFVCDEPSDCCRHSESDDQLRLEKVASLKRRLRAKVKEKIEKKAGRKRYLSLTPCLDCQEDTCILTATTDCPACAEGKVKCNDTFNESRCTLPAKHSGPHDDGKMAWYDATAYEMPYPIHNSPDPHAPGAKLDAGKILASVLLDFGRALEAVAEVGTYGVKKYSRGGWQHVPAGVERYTDAMWRHLLAEHREDRDAESGLRHASHQAWNSLARLELMLREEAKK